MLTRLWINDTLFYLVAPGVVLLVVVSVWLAGQGAIENYRLGLAFDQSIRVLEVAREMRITKGAQAERAADELMKRLEARNIALQAQQQNNMFLGQTQPRAYRSPWETPIKTYFYPDSGTFRLEIETSASLCRRFLSLYSKALEPLGVWRIHLTVPMTGAIWRQIYERGQGKQGLDQQTINMACSLGTDSLISILFFLQPPDK